jgi:hypothetical protein
MTKRLFAFIVLVAGRAWRLLLPRSRCHASPAGGCTDLGRVAALTFGLAALPFLLALSGDCWHEHPDR